MRVLMATGLAWALAASAAEAQPPHALALGEPMTGWSTEEFDPAVPSLQAVLGYAHGQEITSPEDAGRYLEALQAAAPDRMRLIEIGRTWEGRPLRLAIISAPETLARLDAWQAEHRRFIDPRAMSASEAAAFAQTAPVPVWLAYSVHGDEISGADAALVTAYQLLASRDPQTRALLDSTVVILNPMQNPDGRARFVASTRSVRGIAPDPDPASAERDQPWPGGRFNHYLFDLNRDWFALTQPETRAQVREVLAWRPAVLADIHEMSGDSTYFFPPAAAPTNPLQTEALMRMREEIGRSHGVWFDRLGVDYFTRDVYDLFFPGYGDTWPSFHGAVSMTYEQGSARGLAFARRDGRTLTFAETVRNQFVTSMSTIAAAANRRKDLLMGMRRHAEDSIAEGRQARDRSLIIPKQRDQGSADRLARSLAAQGIEVQRAREPFQHCGVRFEAGAYVIDQAQPAHRLAAVLTRQDIPLEPSFAAEQERRRARGLPDQIYDATAWSLPLLYNVDIRRCAGAPSVSTDRVRGDEPVQASLSTPDAKIAFLVPWGDSAAIRVLAGALRQGLRLRSADEAFTLEGVAYPAGTLIFPLAGNEPGLAAKLQALSAESGARIVGVNSSWVTNGPSFGSEDTPAMPPVRVALAWDRPASATGAGATRYVLEQHFGQPTSLLRTRSIRRDTLERFDVLVLPSGSYEQSAFDESQKSAIRDFVRGGGVLIGLGEAMRYLAHPDAGLLSARLEDRFREDGEGKNGGSGKSDDEEPARLPGSLLEDASALQAAILPDTAPPDSVSGVILRAVSDQEHWLAAGIAPDLHVLYDGRDIYTPLKLDEGANVVRFAGPKEVRASGYLWEENAKQLAYKPAVLIEQKGSGYVIGFTVNPTVRGHVEGMNLLFANAIYRAAAHARDNR